MRLTSRARGLLVLALGLTVLAYAFQRLAPLLLATTVVGYLVYAKFRFQRLIVDAAFAANVDGPTRTVFQDRSVRLTYRLQIHPPGIQAQISLPDREDLDVEAIDTETQDVQPTGTRVRARVQVRPRRRGRFRVARLHVDLVDPDGLLEQPYAVRAPLEFTAQTPRSALEEGARMRKLQEIAASPRASPGDVSLELLTHRPYRPSDRDRDIDWKVSSRRQELLTRIHRQEVDRELVLLLDATRPMRYQREGRSMLDHVSKLALAMVKNAHDDGSEIGLAAYDETSVLASRQPSAGRSVLRRASRMVAQLPDPIPTSGEDLIVPRVTGAREDSPSRFERSVAAILGDTEKIPHGLAEAVDRLHGGTSPRIYVVFTPHTHRPSEAEAILSRLARGPSRVVVASPFAPYYLGVDRELRPRDIEQAYDAWQDHQQRLARLDAAGLETVNLSPELRAHELVQAAHGGSR